MGGKQRVIILVLVLAAVAFLLLRPYLTRPPGTDGGFTTTPNPAAAIEEAMASEVPLFIEFYSDT